MLSLYAVFSVFPFGSNTLSYYDMAAQIIPQSELIFDFLNGKSPLFYSTKFGTGANTFGYLIYFILSPFNLLMLLGGEGNLQYSLNFVFILKLICICCVAIWFLKKYFKNLGTLKILILALSYTFCGYMLMVYTYMSFLDYLIYAPIFVDCFNLLKNEDKKLPFIFVVFFMIVSCFSLGCFTLLYLFVIFGAYIFIVVEKKDRKDLILKVLSCIVASIGFAMPILLPSFVQYLSSGRNAGISFIIAYPFHGTPSKILTSIAEIICCFFAIIFIFKCDKKDRLNKFLIFIEMLTLLTIISDEIIMAFNGGGILGYYARFGFIGAFTTFILASKYLNALTFENNEKTKFTIPTYITITVFLSLYAVFVFAFHTPLSNSFASQFSNFPYLFVFIILTMLVLIPCIIAFILKKFIKVHFFICSFILTLSLITGNSVLFFSSGFLSTDSYKSISELTSTIDETDRVKFFSTDYYSLSQTILNCSSTSTFSSLADKDALTSLRRLGYLTSINSTQSFGGTLLSDIVVNNEYSLYPFKVNRWYLELVGEQDGFYLYKNTLCNGYAKILYDKQELSDDILENQQKIYEMLGGTNVLLEQVYPELTFTNCHVENNFIVIDNNLEDSFINFDIDLNEGEILYLYVKSDNNYDISINVDECSISNTCFVDLNTNEKSLIQIYMNCPTDYISFYVLDSNKLQDISSFQSNTYQEYNTLHSTLYLNTDETIMLPFTTLDGYSVYVNGEKQEFTNDFLSYMTLNLDAGENNIKITFNNPSYVYILVGFMLGAILIAAGLLVYYFKEKFNEKFIISIFIIVLSLFITYFIAYPANLTLVKIFTVM